MNTSVKNPLSQEDSLVRTLRETVKHEGQHLTGAASCIIPLLNALSWQGDAREIAEALPHFADEMDVTDLRNVFVALGYETHAQKVALKDLDERLLPCLYQDSKREFPFSVIEKGEKGFKLCYGNSVEWVKPEECALRGTAYYFNLVGRSSFSEKPHIWGWFGAALGRFKRALYMLMAISLFTNLIAVIFPLFIMFIYDRVIGSQSTRALPLIIVGLLIFLGADVSLRIIRSRLLGYIAGRIDYLLGVATFDRIISLPPAYTENAAVSTQLSRLKEFESLRDFFTGSLAQLVFDAPFSLLFIAIIFSIAGPLAFVPVGTLFVFFLMGIFIVPRSRQLSLESGQSSSGKDNLLVEALINMKSIKAAGVEAVWEQRFRTASSTSAAARSRVEVNSAITEALSYALMIFSGMAILWIGAHGVLSGTLSIGALIASMILSWRILSPINAGFQTYIKLDQIKKSLMQLNNLMRLKPEGNGGKSRLLSRNYQGNIFLNRVSFRYSNESDPALLGATLLIPEGQLVSIIGPNSSGKSTILKLIAGMYQPQGGVVSIGGLDLRQVDPHGLRKKISYVPQKTDIFYGTIAQNLRLSNPLATDENLRDAARQIGLLELIEALPDGFNTRIGQGKAESLDPGFIQRLSIARALVRDCSVLLLDEPAQSMDREGDHDLITLLQSLRGAKTIVMISHRPSHIKLSDLVFVVNKGIVEFQGSPEQAMALAQVVTT